MGALSPPNEQTPLTPYSASRIRLSILVSKHGVVVLIMTSLKLQQIRDYKNV